MSQPGLDGFDADQLKCQTGELIMDDLTQSLASVLTPTQASYPNAEAIIINRIPPDWNAYIVIAGARYDYKIAAGGPIVDEELVQKKELKVHTGESVSVFSTKGKCADLIVLACTVIVPGGDPEIQVVTADRKADPANCIARCSMEVVPRRTFDISGKPSGFAVELVSVDKD